MFNLFIRGSLDGWDGQPWETARNRCLNEHEFTKKPLVERYGSFDAASVSALRQLPCIFADEIDRFRGNARLPSLGIIDEVEVRDQGLRVSYHLTPISPFFTVADMATMLFDLDMQEWELSRTHWAVKDVDLSKVLGRRGITLPAWARPQTPTVDITRHYFDVALSFPGSARPLVKTIADELERTLGPNTCFYDNNYTAQLARPSLDVLLQDVYRNRSKLIVVFLGGQYQTRDWCGVEFRAIKEMLLRRDFHQIMFVKLDDEPVEGVFATDGYVDSRAHDPRSIARFIAERTEHISRRPPVPPPPGVTPPTY
jgi:hypothetical protein